MAAPATQAPTRPAYRIRANQLEACNCRHGCNCQFGGGPNEGACEFLMALDITDGHFGDVDLAGMRVAVAAKYPGAIHEGNGHVALFVDESSRPEQVDAIVTIFTGQAGGMPWEALAGTVSRLDGPVRAPITFRAEGRRTLLQIPGVLEAQLTPIRNVVTGEESEVHIVYPKGGFFWNDGNIVTTETMYVRHGDLAFEHPSRFASTSTVDWHNQS